MSCIVEFTDPSDRFEFSIKKHKQKYLINILLKYGQLSLFDLASILDISASTLIEVHHGTCFLVNKQVENLTKIFLIIFNA